MIKTLIVSTCLFFALTAQVYSQDYDPERVNQIENQLTSLEVDIPGLTEKIDIDLRSSTLPIFLLAISEVHKVNIDVNSELADIQIINGFKDVVVKDVLIFLAKNYNLELDVTGSILSFRRAEDQIEEPEEREIAIDYNPATDLLSVDLASDPLSKAFKLISEVSGKGLFYTQNMAGLPVSGFIKELPFELAMEKIAFSNNLIMTKSPDGSYEFETAFSEDPNNPNGVNRNTRNRPRRSGESNFFFEVKDEKNKILDVDFSNVPIGSVVQDIASQLNLDVFTATPLDEAGMATVRAKNISFDQLLRKMFEAAQAETSIQNPNDINRAGNNIQGQIIQSKITFGFKREGNVYYFGTTTQLTQRTSTVIPMFYRSIELLADPTSTGRTAGRTAGGLNGFGNNIFNDINNGNRQQLPFEQEGNRSRDTNGSDAREILDLIPPDILTELSIKTDTELNSFIVSGPNQNVLRFQEFIKQIDKPVPMVLVEVLILEIGNNNTLDAGVEWGLGDSPATTSGSIFPTTSLTLGAQTINKIIGRIDGSSFFNVGTVMPNFFATVRASESNGNFKIKSSPRIATLNGHRAYFSNGETSYYAQRSSNFIGNQTPGLSESVVYLPIDAELSLDVKPFVAADGGITMDIKVVQSSFNGERIAEDAPPGLNSREFTSIVNAQSNDIIVLGGLEGKSVSNNGSGVPFLARIPIIKWLFSKRVRTASKSKLVVLIKPTVIY